MKFTFAALAAMAFGPQAVLSRFKFSFSEIEQCGSFNISFFPDDDAPNDIPVTLTLLPFGAQPITIPIPNTTLNTTGVFVTFLPLTNGTTFVATLDDAEGRNVGRVTDIMRVMPSSTGDSSCLPALTDNTRLFDIRGTPSQCNNFTVGYDRNGQAPTVRIFSPFGRSFPLNLTSDNPDQHRATYLMSAVRGIQAVLLFDDGRSRPETSQLFTIGGDSSSEESCIFKPPPSGKTPDPTSAMAMTNSSGALSREAIIAIAAGGGGAVIVVLILMIVYLIRERRRRRAQAAQMFTIENPTPGQWQGVQLPPTPPTAASFSDTIVRNPPYVNTKYSDAMFDSNNTRNTLSSWIQVVPEDQLLSPRTRNARAGLLSEKRSTRSTFASLDIEQILNMASLKDLNNGSLTSPTSELPPARASAISVGPGQALVNLPSPVLTPSRSIPSRGHLRDPSDIPGDPTYSVTLSALFPTPPTGSGSPYVRSPAQQSNSLLGVPEPTQGERMSYLDLFPSPARTPSPIPPRAATYGLPQNPRSNWGASGSHSAQASYDSNAVTSSPVLPPRTYERNTGDSLGAWYGVAR
ncbi:hypothetical protein HGRIS_005976 [Hohenbuehelia grisea]|uniref:Uncharacterized protein n=1 Tax=Hohenbuehelia grisea TaxID=104357 RepID=A0ABR3JYJ1_9AGAR